MTWVTSVEILGIMTTTEMSITATINSMVVRINLAGISLQGLTAAVGFWLSRSESGSEIRRWNFWFVSEKKEKRKSGGKHK